MDLIEAAIIFGGTEQFLEQECRTENNACFLE